MTLPLKTCLDGTGRRSAKLVSVIVSAFTASFVSSWSLFFPDLAIKSLPIFDGRAVCYPSETILKDYLAWRQADTHINNQVGCCTCIPHPEHHQLNAAGQALLLLGED